MRRPSPLLLLVLPCALAACQQQPEQPANTTAAATPTPVPSPDATAAPRLARYAGQYPTDALPGGTAFLSNPLVRDAVASAVADGAVRARVLDSDVTATPIVLTDGRLLSYGCEPHNCGPHNWTIAITPDGSSASVCYYDEDRRVARWYPQGAGADPASGCPSGE